MAGNLRQALWVPRGLAAPGDVTQVRTAGAANTAVETELVPNSANPLPVGQRGVFAGVAPPTNAVSGDIWFDTSNAAKPIPKVLSPGGQWNVAGDTLPVATRHGQTLVAGTAPTFPWAAGDVDMGRY